MFFVALQLIFSPNYQDEMRFKHALLWCMTAHLGIVQLFAQPTTTVPTPPLPQAPAQMDFAGIKLSLTAPLRARMDAYMAEIVKYPSYFDRSVDRAHTFLPFVEEGLANVGVPQDLKYIAIQESGLKSDAVSKSNAVGFWQMKLEAALQYGLRVTDRVDERQHVYRSSEAAAAYFAKANQDFNNWLYAVVAYYEGLTGAVKYTNPQYYGVKAMVVDTSLHWYAMRALCHKLVYEPLLQKKTPKIWLEPLSSQGLTNIEGLYTNRATKEQFLEYNTWILNKESLPQEQLFTYYIPHFNDTYAGHKQDPNKVKGGGAPVYLPPSLQTVNPQPVALETPKPPIHRHTNGVAAQPDMMEREHYVEFKIQEDLHYGEEFILYTGNELLAELATRYNQQLQDIVKWNDLIMGVEPAKGTILYLHKPEDRAFYIVRPGEKLTTIGAITNVSSRRIEHLNNLSRHNAAIYEGQKLYLHTRKPADEKVIILRPSFDKISLDPRKTPADDKIAAIVSESLQQLGEKQQAAAPKTQPTAMQAVAPQPATTAPYDPAKAPVQEVRTRWVDHTVDTGETLWQIATRYGTKVEIIKLTNKLTTDSLTKGQVLKILAKEDKLAPAPK